MRTINTIDTNDIFQRYVSKVSLEQQWCSMFPSDQVVNQQVFSWLFHLELLIHNGMPSNGIDEHPWRGVR